MYEFWLDSSLISISLSLSLALCEKTHLILIIMIIFIFQIHLSFVMMGQYILQCDGC